MSVLHRILEHKIIAIIRGVEPENILPIAGALQEGGIRLVEVTLNTRGALGAIERIAQKLAGNIWVGAGTVLDEDGAKAAIAAGALFVISPHLDRDVIERTRQLGAVSIPGAFTATEIITAYKWGGELIKWFPASAGPAALKDLRGPLPHIPLMPTGGVNLQNIAAFQAAGASAYGIGSALVDAKQNVTEKYLNDLTKLATKFVEELKPKATI